MVAVPYLITVVAMGYSRQGVALGLVMLGLSYLATGATYRFATSIVIAATFHKTAFLLLPLGILATQSSRTWIAIWTAVLMAILYQVLVDRYVDRLLENYIEAEVQSEGAAVRVLMNVIAACLFFIVRSQLHLRNAEKRLWTYMSLGALACLALLALTPSSTAVDRMALYFIPLQLYVGSRVPDVCGHKCHIVSAAVVSYSATVFAVWFLFATYSDHWLPYQVYPIGSDNHFVYHLRGGNPLELLPPEQ